MSITTVESPEQFTKELSNKLKRFMENNETFNIQGSWTGDDGVTVSVLVDYGIESRDGEHYVGSISACFDDNKEFDFDGDVAESDTFREAENAFTSAVYDVFQVPYNSLYPDTNHSDIDLCSHFSIMHGIWETQDDIDYSGNQ